MENISGYICISSVCFAPLIMFALGIAVGSGKIKLPFRVRLEKVPEKDFEVQLQD
jgi:hypothetical protein